MNADDRVTLETEKAALLARRAQLLDKLVDVHAKIQAVDRQLAESA